MKEPININMEEAWGSDVEVFIDMEVEGPVNTAAAASQQNSHGTQQQGEQTGRITSNTHPVRALPDRKARRPRGWINELNAELYF